MPFLSDDDRQVVAERLAEELEAAVAVTVYSEPLSGLYVPGRRSCLTCRESEQLMEEVAELSERVELSIVNVREDAATAADKGIQWTPTITVGPANEPDARARFLGLPGGFEFMAFLETLMSASKPQFALRPESAEKLAALDEEVEIKTFVTPT